MPTPGDDGNGEPIAANEAGDVVGRAWWTVRTPSSTFTRETVGLWKGGRFLDLNDALPEGWHLERAFGIDDRAWILANGTAPGAGHASTILLKPRSS